MPGWLERLKTDYFLRRISRHDLEEIHDTAVKAAIKDQEMAGIDIVTDGELRRDNMIDYFAGRLPGVQIDHASKKFYYDFFDSVVRGKLPTAPLGLVDDFKFLRRFTERPTKFSITGPHSLVRRIRNEYYPSEEAFALDIARVMNLELRELVKAGATYLQIDEPYYSGFPEDVRWGVKVLNVLTEGVDAKIGLHICYGNRYGKPTWEGSYRYLFPAILDARVQQLTLEFARRGEEDVALFREFKAPFELGLGVIDVKNPTVETPDMVAERIRKALEIVPAERLYVNPDCGCLHLPRDVAFAKLCAMVEGTRLVRKELET
ncbi:MAG: 5-methyltetrahydropteroyltriglutamate--homocysteine S-methyltransferase [Candidatus Rokubacteria bacterium CSP1-6]|nr:MAG: 5-methyltetrahydropteroyltriglutamate--homocysteine S-methyltransferase [Candidatus Rokubacteria bacterium CSP1-6]